MMFRLVKSGGVPARKIGTFEDYVERYRCVCEEKKNYRVIYSEKLSNKRIEQEWSLFDRRHDKK